MMRRYANINKTSAYFYVCEVAKSSPPDGKWPLSPMDIFKSRVLYFGLYKSVVRRFFTFNAYYHLIPISDLGISILQYTPRVDFTAAKYSYLNYTFFLDNGLDRILLFDVHITGGKGNSEENFPTVKTLNWLLKKHVILPSYARVVNNKKYK